MIRRLLAQDPFNVFDSSELKGKPTQDPSSPVQQELNERYYSHKKNSTYFETK